jgi:chromosome segregation ATPase
MTVPLPSKPGQSIPIPNYNDLMQSKQEREQRIEKYTADLNRLYARYNELENEKQTILEQINSLEQKKKGL